MAKLFVYGTLGLGNPNEHILKKIGGSWEKGFVWGKLFKEGWGAEMGFPGIKLEEKTEKIEGYIFCSDRIHEHWKVLDDFEGIGYERVKATVIMGKEEKKVEAFIYALK